MRASDVGKSQSCMVSNGEDQNHLHAQLHRLCDERLRPLLVPLGGLARPLDLLMLLLTFLPRLLQLCLQLRDCLLPLPDRLRAPLFFSLERRL